VLAARGYASLTIGDVARKAGLSMGIINFHFSSKETLLAETLRYLARGYRDNWMSAVEAAGADPAATALRHDHGRLRARPRHPAHHPGLGQLLGRGPVKARL
jgi:AcrR family transcriptional regulator